MSVKPDNLKLTDTEQFSDLASRLQNQVNDESVLAEIHVAIKELLSNNSATEARIREILQRRYDSGDLRPETFELVHKMLDRIRSANVARTNDGTSTLVLDREPAVQGDGAYARTLVIGDNMAVDSLQPEALFINTAVIEDEGPADKIMDSQQLQVGSILRDRFLLQRQLLGGGTGLVYKALDQRLAEADDENAFVAVKVLPSQISRNEKALSALQQEMAKGRCLNHPNIVRLMDLDREGNLNFIVMEWLDGKSLATILQESGSKKIDIHTTMDIVKQVSLALDYAHERGVVHGDVNPGNIRITTQGEVKVFDFGIARVLQKEQDRQPDFDPRELGAKSPEYSSMQVLTGEDPVPADDVFSLACLMYRLIAGHRVFGPRSAAEAASEGMEPQQPPGLPQEMWPALKKALAYSRVPRFKSPKEFVAALGDIPSSHMMELPQPPKARKPDQSTIDTQTVPPIDQAQATPARSGGADNPVRLSNPFEKPDLTRPPAPRQTVPPIGQQAQAPQQRPHQPAQPPHASQSITNPPPAQPQNTSHSMELPQPARSQVVVADEPLAPRRFDIEPRGSRWGLIFLGMIVIGAGALYLKPEWLDLARAYVPPEWIEAAEGIIARTPSQPIEQTAAEAEPEATVAGAATEETVAEEPATDEPVAAEAATDETATEEAVTEEAVAEESVDEETIVDASDDAELIDDEPIDNEPVAEEPQQESVAEAAVEETPPEPDPVDLLPADLTVGLVATGQFVPEIEVTLREDAGDVTIDLVRMHNMRESLTVLLEEVGFSGNRSPWEEGQYVIANNGIATFEAGQSRVRTRISMSTDSVREADSKVTVQVREIDNAAAEFARINLTLEDDDRRAYEASLPLDTVAFVVSEVFVSEADPAVQVDVVRFKPSNRALEVKYVVNDLTTKAGEDYFPPGVPTIYFSPNQRSARILIPLVQDSDPEDSEVFALEFVDPARYLDPEIFQSVAIMIRDDD